MPTMSKSLNEMPEIAAMWKAARLAVAEAESIAFFGFSMPASDELLVQMFRSAIAVNGKLKRVAAIDLSPDNVLSRFSDCVPSGCKVTYTPFKVTPGERPDWFADAGGSDRSAIGVPKAREGSGRPENPPAASPPR
jgi:hypothetical protein